MATPIDLDVRVDMYLRPTSTGVYDWVPINRANGMIVQRSDDIVVADGNQDLNRDVGVPNRAKLTIKDAFGHLNPQNPMGAYWGSIGLGTPLRIAVMRVDDQGGRTMANTNWGSVGNGTDSWTAGTSSGGTVAAGDWSVSGGTMRHSLPVAGAYRLSELSKTVRPFINVGALLHTLVPTSNVTGTGALATEVWLRTIDVSNFLAVSLAFQIDETLQIAIYDRTAGVNRYLLNYTTIPGLSLTTSQEYLLRCHVEGSTVRAKVWAVGSPEPKDWQVTGSNAAIRQGYLSVADYAFSGNTNAFPLVFQHSYLQADIPVHFGEITNLVPTGEDKNEIKKVAVSSAGILDILKTNKSSEFSVMRRERSGARRWLKIGSSRQAGGGDTRTFILLTANLGDIKVGDFFWLYSATTGRRVDDTLYTITALTANAAFPATFTDIGFTPDARDAVTSDNKAHFYRSVVATNMPVAYYPMEDGNTATQISSGLINGEPMSIVGDPRFGAESGFKASDSVLQLNDAELTAVIPDYVDAGVITVNFLLSMPSSDEAATSTDLLQWYCTGTGYSYDLKYAAGTTGCLQLQVFNSSLVSLFDSGAIEFSMRGDKAMITLVLKQVGGTVTYSLFKIQESTGDIGGVGPLTVTGVTTLGKITQIRVNPGGGYKSVGIGHLAVVPSEWTADSVFSEFTAWAGQPAVHRYARLCYENQIPFTFRSDGLGDAVSANLGAQKSGKLADVIEDPAKSDDGHLIGARGAMALEYITRGATCNLDPIATFDASLSHVKFPFEPTADFTDVENKVTVERIDGTKIVSELTAGRLSTQEPPNGIRVRPGGYQLSLDNDTDAPLHADWRLAVGTQDRYRVPQLNVTAVGSSALSVEKLLSLSVGMHVDITNLTSKNIYDPVELLVIGTSLRLGRREYPQLTMVGQPYEVHRAFALTANDRARPGMTDSKLGTVLSTSYTGAISITSDTGYYLVTTDAADFPLNVMIEGEEITLSSCSGDLSPQSAVISARSVNGVIKTHVVGETIQLYRPNYYQFR